MIITKTLIHPTDGRELTYHKVVDVILNEKKNTATFVVGSFETADTSQRPDHKTDIVVYYAAWDFEYYNKAPETVMGHPDWNGSQPKPSTDHIWNPLTFTWMPPKDTLLEELRSKKWNEIKMIRNSVEFGGFEFNGNRFDSTQTSFIRISNALQIALVAQLSNTEYTTTWTLSDNTSITLNRDDVIGMGIALNTHIKNCHEKGVVLRNLIALATTKDDLDVIIW